MPNGTQTTQLQPQWKVLFDLVSGDITYDQAKERLFQIGFPQADIETFLQQGLAMAGREEAPWQTTGETTTDLSQLRGLEQATDPYTAYLEKMGIGGKQFYNPAERYQAGLFDPYMDIWNVQQRLYGQGGPLGGPDVLPGEQAAGTFAEFLNRTGTGLGSLTQAATGQLRNIFGAPSETRGTLGYEPGQYLPGEAGEAGGGLDPGQLQELQNLMRYGLRSTSGPMGARYAAGRLPQAQQAYYGQKAAGTAGAENFLDWLNKNWRLGF